MVVDGGTFYKTYEKMGLVCIVPQTLKDTSELVVLDIFRTINPNYLKVLIYILENRLIVRNILSSSDFKYLLNVTK